MTTIQDIAKRTTALFELLAALNKAADDAGLPESVCFTGYMHTLTRAKITVTNEDGAQQLSIDPGAALSRVRTSVLVTFEDFLTALTGA
jgi:hypothetical protein